MKHFMGYVSKIVFSRMIIIFLMIIFQALVLVAGFKWLGNYMSFIWEGMSLLGAVLIIFIINRDEPAEFKMTWIIPICLFPVLGALLYVFVIGNVGGLGLRAKYYQRTEETKDLLFTSPKTEEILKKCPAHFRGFVHYMQHTAGYPAYQASEAQYYPLGEDKFEDLKKELLKAKSYIFLEYFIVERGIMWNGILDILKEKVKEGVEVRVMYDGMCSILLLPYRYPKELRKYGIKAKMFAPIMPFLSTNQNNRDHRKIVVIDGKVAFTGGVNLADEYINQKRVYGHWKDTAVKVTGDAVRSFTVMFLQMWNVSEKTEEDYERYLQDVEEEAADCNDGIVIPYGGTPTRKEETVKTVYESMISGAARYVHIMSPYFIVEREFLDCMRYASQRDVEVAMILPHIPDKKIVYYIARTFYPELLKAGIKVYEYTPGFVHAKVFVSDDEIATVGTVNLDYRSFYHHFECGACFFGGQVVRQAEEDFRKTLQSCQEVTWDYYKKIPLRQKVIGRIFRLLGPLM